MPKRTRATAVAAPAQPPWLLLIHQLPPSPAYLRVKVRRRLNKLGAIPLKSTVYALPNNETSLEDFEWLAREIVADGGDVFICAATILRGGTDHAGGIASGPPGRGPSRSKGIDTVEPGRTWVTRRNVGIDRISSGWLIRQFIDPTARFKFADERYRPRPGELRFDMFQAEYGHDGTRCTFETLLSRFRLLDPGLKAIGEMVHDLDCKDDRYGRPEATGVATLIDGIVRTCRTDAERLKRGADILNELHRGLSSRPPRRARR